MTREQLESAANDVFYLAQEMFAFYAWKSRVEPRLGDLPTPLHATLVRNAVIEAQLMFYRKLNEFFRPANARFPDDLKSELFGYRSTGGFMVETEISELHKRVAHPTTREATHGKVAYEIYNMSYVALEHTIPFLKHLSQHFYTPDSEASRSMIAGTAVLRKIWDELIGPEKNGHGVLLKGESNRETKTT
ncbi:MAG: hypothetical protein IT582_05440 [Opitutaceae bacterium]|nr:hypothetical protein [Opitutaceae bacterium]